MVEPSLTSRGFALPSLPFPAPSRQGQPGPALPDDAETLQPPFGPGAEHLTGSGSSGGVPASQQRPQAGTRCATSAPVLSPSCPRRFRPVPAALPAPTRPSPRGEEVPGAAVPSPRSRGLVPAAGFVSVPPGGWRGEDGEARFWQQDVGRRRGGEGAVPARKRPPCPGKTLMGWDSRAELAAGEQLRHTGPS